MKFGLTAYGTTFDMGIHPQSGKPRIDAIEFVHRAARYGFEGVEIPLDMLVKSDIDAVRREVQQSNMFVTIAAGGYDVETLKEALLIGRHVGAVTVRTVVGGADYGGDRRHMKGKWQPFLDVLTDNFKRVTETAEAVGVNLAVENHQDLASEELLELCRTIGSDRFGITLDTANVLATAEEPIDYYNRVAANVKNIHLKDYKIYWSEEGYRLVRCAVGQGAIPFPELLRIFAENNPGVTMSLEHGALVARHVRIHREDYWTEYPPRTAAQLTNVMQFVHNHARSSGEWRTPFEQGGSPERICDYERNELAASIAYLQALEALYG
jgi:3-oxoisoapionate decarboxylase